MEWGKNDSGVWSYSRYSYSHQSKRKVGRRFDMHAWAACYWHFTSFLLIFASQLSLYVCKTYICHRSTIDQQTIQTKCVHLKWMHRWMFELKGSGGGQGPLSTASLSDVSRPSIHYSGTSLCTPRPSPEVLLLALSALALVESRRTGKTHHIMSIHA